MHTVCFLPPSSPRHESWRCDTICHSGSHQLMCHHTVPSKLGGTDGGQSKGVLPGTLKSVTRTSHRHNNVLLLLRCDKDQRRRRRRGTPAGNRTAYQLLASGAPPSKLQGRFVHFGGIQGPRLPAEVTHQSTNQCLCLRAHHRRRAPCAPEHTRPVRTHAYGLDASL